MGYDISISEKFDFSDNGNTVEVIIRKLSAVNQIRLIQAIQTKEKIFKRIKESSIEADSESEVNETRLEEFTSLLDQYDHQTTVLCTIIANNIISMTCNGTPAGGSGVSWCDMSQKDKIELLQSRPDIVTASVMRNSSKNEASEETLEK